MFQCQRCRTTFNLINNERSNSNSFDDDLSKKELMILMVKEIFEYATEKTKIDHPICLGIFKYL
jgi:hypothetical protein